MRGMSEQIIELIAEYGLEAVCIALCVNLLTAVVKLPIKALANKTSDSTRITRFIVFLPILFGFVVSFLYSKFFAKNFAFNKEFVTLWFTSASLSLTLYAIFEKIVPQTKKQKSDNVDETNIVEDKNGETTIATTSAPTAQKIILGRQQNEDTEAEK